MIMNSQHRLSVELSLSVKGHCSLSVFGVYVCVCVFSCFNLSGVAFIYYFIFQ